MAIDLTHLGVFIVSLGIKMLERTLLITGAHGFIGRHIARLFNSKGWYVVGIGHGGWSKEEAYAWGVSEWHQSDITSSKLKSLNTVPDVIVHAAGGSSVPLSIQSPEQDFSRTVSTTEDVLEYLRHIDSNSKLIYLSAAGVYGTVKILPIRENVELYPLSPYGKHKVAAEGLCSDCSTSYGVDITVIRLFSIYGAGLKKQLLWDALNKIVQNETEFFGTGEEVRDWLHVDDAASLVFTVAESANKGYMILNGGTGKGVVVRDLLTQLYSLYGFNRPLSFSGLAREGDPVGYLADITKAKALGWKPTVSLQTGLLKYVEWFKANYNG